MKDLIIDCFAGGKNREQRGANHGSEACSYKLSVSESRVPDTEHEN